MTTSDWKTLGVRRARTHNTTKSGVRLSVERGSYLKRCQTRSGQGRSRRCSRMQGPTMYGLRCKNEHTPMQQEPASISGYKRSVADDEAIRRADSEAEKALKRSRSLEERGAAKRASATSVQELDWRRSRWIQRRRHPVVLEL